MRLARLESRDLRVVLILSGADADRVAKCKTDIECANAFEELLAKAGGPQQLVDLFVRQSNKRWAEGVEEGKAEQKAAFRKLLGIEDE